MSKLDLLRSVMIFSFVTMNLKGRDRKYAAFAQIALTSTMKSEAVNGKALEGLQARSNPVYEPMSVSHILRLGHVWGKKNPVGLRSRNPAGFDSIDLLMYSSQISRKILRSYTFTKSVFQHRSPPQFGSHHPRTGLLLPLWRGRMRNIRHRAPVPEPTHCYNPPARHKIPYTP